MSKPASETITYDNTTGPGVDSVKTEYAVSSTPGLDTTDRPERYQLRREDLPVRAGRRAHIRRQTLRSGAHAIVRAYYAGELDQRYAPGRYAREMGRLLARHKGYERLDD